MSSLEVQAGGQAGKEAGWSSFRRMTLYMTHDGRIMFSLGPHWYGPVMTTIVIMFVFTLNRVIIDRSHCTDTVKSIFFYLALVICIIGELLMITTALVDNGMLVSGPDAEECSSLVGSGKVPYCESCMLYQINNAAHCSFCDCCVEELDHHCPWMGKCIGKGNMFWFKCFIVTVIIFLVQFAIVGIKFA